MEQQSAPNIILWAVPRSISTGFFRTMESRKNCRVFLEPFTFSHSFGADRVSVRYLNHPNMPGSSYYEVKAKLEEAARTKDKSETIFVKDMAFNIMQHKDREALIPKGYRHVFIIRNPNKTIASLYKMFTKCTESPEFKKGNSGFKESWELYQFVKRNVDPEAFVIDADDMISDPHRYFQMFCDKMGIEFQEEMLHWCEDTEAKNHFFKIWFGNVISSNTFVREGFQKEQQSPDELPEAVVECIRENMTYYEKLMEVKVKFLSQ